MLTKNDITQLEKIIKLGKEWGVYSKDLTAAEVLGIHEIRPGLYQTTIDKY
jgi:hypothetical protein